MRSLGNTPDGADRAEELLETLNERGIRVLLTAFAQNQNYVPVLRRFSLQSSLLKRLGINHIFHHDKPTQWDSNRGHLNIGPGDFSLEMAKKVLDALGVIATYGDFVSVDHCVFPNAYWAADFLQCNMSEIRGKFRQVSLTDQTRRSGDTLLINTATPEPAPATFRSKLLSILAQAPRLGAAQGEAASSAYSGDVPRLGSQTERQQQPGRSVLESRPSPRQVRSWVLEVCRFVLGDDKGSVVASKIPFSSAQQQIRQEQAVARARRDAAEVRGALAMGSAEQARPAQAVQQAPAHHVDVAHEAQMAAWRRTLAGQIMQRLFPSAAIADLEPRSHDETASQLSVTLQGPPPATIFLKMSNGENPEITIERFDWNGIAWVPAQVIFQGKYDGLNSLKSLES
ncbi:MAG: hypothetical protein AAB588_06455 [Patescibacteria group bacterium]